jgi:hypothetical protein
MKWINIVLGFLLFLLLLLESSGRGDIDIFINASEDLLRGGNIYKIKYHQWYHYYYDILFALVISPLRLVPIYWATFIWLVLNIFFTYRIWKVILFYLPVEVLKIKHKRILTILSFFFIYALWHRNIHLGQMTIFIVYLCLEGMYQIYNKKLLLGSMFIGLGISIKILPITLIPYLIYRGYFRATIYCVLTTIVILLFPGFIIGYDYHIFLLQERWNLINPLNKEHILDVSERSFHSLTSLLSILFVENAGNTYSLELKRNITSVDLTTLNVIINSFRVFLITGVLVFIRALPFQNSRNKIQLFYELSYILLVTPLIFPHQQHYAFFFIFPAITYLVFYFIIMYFYTIGKKISFLKKMSLLVIVLLVYFLLNSHFILGAYRNIYDHFKTLTYGVMFLIPLLAIMRPARISQLIKR